MHSQQVVQKLNKTLNAKPKPEIKAEQYNNLRIKLEGRDIQERFAADLE